MSRSPRMSLGVQALLILMLPMLGLMWLTYHDVRQSNAVVASSTAQIQFTKIAALAGAVVHETQKERGLTASVLDGQGREFAAALPEQRKTRDASLTALKAYLATVDRDTLGASLNEKLEKSLSHTAGIANMRQLVDARAVTASDAVTLYVQVVADYLNLAAEMPRLSEQREIATLGNAYIALLRLKESSGIERNTLSAAFSQDAFTRELATQFTNLITAQSIFYDQLQNSIGNKRQAYLNTYAAIDGVVRAEQMRRTAQRRIATGNFGISAIDWFEQQSQKIDALKSLEEQLVSELSAAGRALQEAAERQQFNSMLVGLLAMFAVVFAIFWNTVKFRGLNRDLGADAGILNTAITRLGQGDFAIDLSTAKPATGVMAGLQTMQRSLHERNDAEKRTLAESKRVEQALSTVQSKVLITNDALEIVFINDAASALFSSLSNHLNKIDSSFDTTRLLGNKIDALYIAAGEQPYALRDLTGTKSIDVRIGQRTLRVEANPVQDDLKNRIGVIFAVQDRTIELGIENEMQSVVEAAQGGDLTQRIDEAGKAGFYGSLSQNVNALLSVSEQVIGDTVRVFSAIAHGSLQETIDADYAGSFDTLKRDANSTIDQLTDVLGSIQTTASSVRSGAAEISSGNNNLRLRTEEQAGSLEKTAASMEQITGTVRQNAGNVTRASDLAQATRMKAKQGGIVVGNAVSAMEEISTSSRRIADIIGVIDEIAFQTNLLALNAAVEAARAGEQGRGFAVVASEVRNLAGRSASAAKEIKSLIEDSNDKVDEGARLVNESGQTLEDIVNEVQRLTDTVGEIATASQEQYKGIDQVNANIIQIDAFTQQNSALVEEASAASESLGMQAEELEKLIAFFEVDPSKATDSDSFTPLSVERRVENRPWHTPPEISSNDAVADSSEPADVAQWRDF
ncbi:MAG: methyl-accepting chemotaxis protein [Pseudomonadota bacterium]